MNSICACYIDRYVMGREASCRCRWGTEEIDVKALLESNQLLLRGGIRRSISFSEIQDVSADGNSLIFRMGDDRIALELGEQVAARWAKAIVEPPSLAKKLGISSGKQVKVFGVLADRALEAALADSAPALDGKADLIFLLVQTPEELEQSLGDSDVQRTSGAPVWVVYPKGKGKLLSESEVRRTLRARGMVDTKVASVSETLTALRFSHDQRRASLTAD